MKERGVCRVKTFRIHFIMRSQAARWMPLDGRVHCGRSVCVCVWGGHLSKSFQPGGVWGTSGEQGKKVKGGGERERLRPAAGQTAGLIRGWPFHWSTAASSLSAPRTSSPMFHERLNAGDVKTLLDKLVSGRDFFSSSCNRVFFFKCGGSF